MAARWLQSASSLLPSSLYACTAMPRCLPEISYVHAAQPGAYAAVCTPDRCRVVALLMWQLQQAT